MLQRAHGYIINHGMTSALHLTVVRIRPSSLKPAAGKYAGSSRWEGPYSKSSQGLEKLHVMAIRFQDSVLSKHMCIIQIHTS